MGKVSTFISTEVTFRLKESQYSVRRYQLFLFKPRTVSWLHRCIDLKHPQSFVQILDGHVLSVETL